MSTESHSLDAIRRIVEEALGLSLPDPQADLVGLGANSMELVRVINRLEDELSYRPDFADLGANPTLASIAAAYEAYRNQRQPTVSHPRPGILPALTPPARHDVVSAIRTDGDRIRINLTPDASVSHQRHVGSVRRFQRRPLPEGNLSRLLSGLHTPSLASGRSAKYASAGGRHAVQVYLQTAPGAVSDVPCGLYYLQPELPELWQIVPDLAPDPTLVEPVVNGPIISDAAFLIHLIWRPAALQPIYGERARDYALQECGAMLQLLREAAPCCGLGLCVIGELEFDAVRMWFELDVDQEWLAGAAGGVLV